MRILFDLFLSICLLRKGPQDVPASRDLLKLTLAAYGLSSLLVQLITASPLTALLQALLDVGLLTGLTYGVLNLTGHRARFVQTLSALAGSGVLLALVILPVVIWGQQEVAESGGMGLYVLVSWVWLVWSIAVVTHILRHALSTSPGVALLYTLGYLAISILLAGLFFPETF